MIHKLLFIFIGVIVLLLPLVTYAALLPTPTGSCPTVVGVQLVCQLGKCVTSEGVSAPGYELPCNFTLDDILQSGVNFINLILGIVGGLALLIFVYGGYQMLTSMGNPEGIKKGKDTLTGGFIGLILILGAAIFVWFATKLLGANISPAGEISPGKVECKLGDDGIGKCGGSDEWACQNGVCVTACDFLASTAPDWSGFSCQTAEESKGKWQISGAEGECSQGKCPSGTQCCITALKKASIKKQ